MTYLAMLGRVTRRKGWRSLAYCLMANHVHLLIETPEPNLGAGMQLFHGSYAQWFNERHGRSGHLFQGRFGAVSVQDDEQLWTVVRYIAMNPVRAGLCERPEDWLWSSYRGVLRDSAPRWLDIARLHGYLGAMGGGPGRRYVDLVAGSTSVAA